MESHHHIKLIDSTYTAEEACEVLLSLLNDKIKFLKIKAHSIEERYSGDTTHLEQRIKELTADRERIFNVLQDAREKGLEVELVGLVNIELKVPTEHV